MQDALRLIHVVVVVAKFTLYLFIALTAVSLVVHILVDKGTNADLDEIHLSLPITSNKASYSWGIRKYMKLHRTLDLIMRT